ncbi:MAG: hypothetical protein QOI74_1064 [Micromonosporaceae bacterium]|jgi:glycosyltransferase involved in cell wall biosynthesis|nr:hypothetical protein [Micromonosporaceae bacterium]MDT5037542.1 hypothetical protein [Micromonosporaceae bacterium]
MFRQELRHSDEPDARDAVLLASGPPRVSVVIPTLNEARNLPHVAARLTGVDEIVVVDGHSTDDTVSVAAQVWPHARIVRQTRKGKGNALACGFAVATGDIIVMLDADGSADPAEIPAYVAALTGGADFAKGSRFCLGGGSSDITRWRWLGNRVLNGIVNLLYGTRYTDLCYGYNAFWAYCLPTLGLKPGERGTDMDWGDGFEVETLINVRIAEAGLTVTEVPSFERERIHGVSKLNAVADGLRVLRTIARERWRRPARPAAVVADTTADATERDRPADPPLSRREAA